MDDLAKNESTYNPYQIHISSEEIFLQYQLNLSKGGSIHILSGAIKEVEQNSIRKKVIYSTIQAKAIGGIIKIEYFDFLIYVKSSLRVGIIDGCDIGKIKEIDYIPIISHAIDPEFSNDTKSYLNGIKELLKGGFFYSFGYDLTATRQKQSKNINDGNTNNNYDNNERATTTTVIDSNSQQSSETDIGKCFHGMRIFKTSDKKFFWNYNGYKKFLNEKDGFNPINYNFIVPIICGYVSIFEEEIEKKKLKFILISRRSQNHVGTRYNTRGINDDGHCANYCESEQIVQYDSNILSFTQIRGSAPVFFQQVGMTYQTVITRTPELTVQAFTQHLSEIQKDYTMLYCINGGNKFKEGEDIITKAFETQVKSSDNRKIRYYFFDMQTECRGDDYTAIDYGMSQIDPVLNIFQFFSENESTHEIHKDQSGTIRTNCLDCLDRTNVIQTRISWLVLERMGNRLNLNTEKIFHSEPFFTFAPNNTFKETFKTIWAENGDYISIQYAGTASTITTVTKHGGHSIMGLLQHGIVSVSRIYQGNFEDTFKQKLFDIGLQKNNDDNFISPGIENELRKQEKKFTTFEDFYVYVGNWNIGGKELSDVKNIFEWLLPNNALPGKEMRPDIYLIGFEEIVDGNAKNIMIYSNSYRKDKIKSVITDALSSISNKNEPYAGIKEGDSIGIYFLAFVKKSKMSSITNIDELIIKSGGMGNIGNKGSGLLRFNIHNTSCAVACSHLSAGKKYSETRRSEIIEIMNRSFPKYPNIMFKEYDFYYFFGDLNSRINGEIPQCLGLIQEDKYSEGGKYDQFMNYRKETSIISQMDEGEIKFKPTYKYVFNSVDYDTQKRTPSYCDRILYRKGSRIDCLAYNRCEYTGSDHRPVYGIYKMKVWKINRDERNKLITELKQQSDGNAKQINTVFDINSINAAVEENFFNWKNKNPQQSREGNENYDYYLTPKSEKSNTNNNSNSNNGVLGNIGTYFN